MQVTADACFLCHEKKRIGVLIGVLSRAKVRTGCLPDPHTLIGLPAATQFDGLLSFLSLSFVALFSIVNRDSAVSGGRARRPNEARSASRSELRISRRPLA